MKNFCIVKTSKEVPIASLEILNALYKEMSDFALAYYINSFIKANNGKTQVGVCKGDIRFNDKSKTKNEKFIIECKNDAIIITFYKIKYEYELIELKSFEDVVGEIVGETDENNF